MSRLFASLAVLGELCVKVRVLDLRNSFNAKLAKDREARKESNPHSQEMTKGSEFLEDAGDWPDSK